MSNSLKLAQAITSTEIYGLILHLRQDMVDIKESLVKLPGELYPRKDAEQIRELLKAMETIFDKLSKMAIESGVTSSIPEGAKFMERKAILQDLLNRRVIIKRRLNGCLTRCRVAFDNWAGSVVHEMFITVWGATREGLKSLTPLMHDFFVEEESKTQSQAQPQAQGTKNTPQGQKGGKWGKNKK